MTRDFIQGAAEPNSATYLDSVNKPLKGPQARHFEVLTCRRMTAEGGL